MKSHYSIEDFDYFLESNATQEEKEKMQNHLTECENCRKKYEILRSIGDYLETEEKVDELLTERLVGTLNKNRYTKKRRKKKATGLGILKPAFSVFLIAVFAWLAFSMGMKFDFLRNNPADQQQDNMTITQGTEKPDITQTPPEKKEITLTLYFPNLNADCVVPEERLVEVYNDAQLERIIFEELMKGPEESGKTAVIPPGSRLLSVETIDGVCRLNLSSEFVDNNPGGTAFESVLINSIVNSLTELSYVEKVQFLIEGEKREVYTHAVFDLPFERNEDFIKSPDDTSEAIEIKIRELGKRTLEALRDRDMEWLSSVIHPDKNLRFSPYTYVNIDTDLVFTAEEVKTLLKSDKVYNWGKYDGSGEDIELTFEEYFSKFVYDKDFLNAEEEAYNRYIARGNTLNNIFEVYPEAKMMEYYFSGFDPKYEGFDWESLKLVFEEKDGIWYLVGIVHDGWTI
jgi:spore germination protein GerM